MATAQVKTHKPTPQVLSLARKVKLPSIREWAESRPAVDPVLIQRLRGAK